MAPASDSGEFDFNAASAAGNLSTRLQRHAAPAKCGGVGSQAYDMTVEHLVVTLPGGGTQTLNASAFPGDLDVRGLGGTDILTGYDEADRSRAGSGNDTVNAQDGGFDFIDCGAGTTRPRSIHRQVIGCESVQYSKPKTSAVKGPKNIKKGKSGAFKFSSSVPGSVFQCRIDKKAWKTCRSPYTVSTTEALRRAAHGRRASRLPEGQLGQDAVEEELQRDALKVGHHDPVVNRPPRPSSR